MRFLNMLFWIVVVALVSVFSARNWRDVTVDLWGNLQADFKLPVLLLIAFLIGLVPTWLIFRAKLWRVNNRVTIAQRNLAATTVAEGPEVTPQEPEL